MTVEERLQKTLGNLLFVNTVLSADNEKLQAELSELKASKETNKPDLKEVPK